jgi:hypothetical protein
VFRRLGDQTEPYLAALRMPRFRFAATYAAASTITVRDCANSPRVFSLAAELDKAVEIDAYPEYAPRILIPSEC